MADDSGTVYPMDQEIYDSYAPRIAGTDTACTILWIKTGDHRWALLSPRRA